MLNVILDTLIDGLKLIPFLFIAFLIIELIEHKLSNKSKKMISQADKLGPVIGSLLGIFPQCGFSVMATNLYITRIISLGTLIAVYLSTSDEMLPIMLSEKVNIFVILNILIIKFIFGMMWGFIIDAVIRKYAHKKEKITYEICEEEHCHCEKNILESSLKHTFNTLVFIMLITFVLNVMLNYLGDEFLSILFLKNSFLGPFVTSLFGLIPNCGASVMITELYLHNAITLGSAIGGLLTGSGVALLVLLKSNKDFKESVIIISVLYGIGVISGILIEVIGMIVR